MLDDERFLGFVIKRWLISNLKKRIEFEWSKQKKMTRGFGVCSQLNTYN